MSYSNTTYF